jgi:hypothetical protein
MIRDPEKTYSGSRGEKDIGSRIRNTAKPYMNNNDLPRVPSWD